MLQSSLNAALLKLQFHSFLKRMSAKDSKLKFNFGKIKRRILENKLLNLASIFSSSFLQLGHSLRTLKTSPSFVLTFLSH